MTYHGYVAVQSRGVVALPAELRRRLNLDEAGTQMEITEREDGVLEFRATVPVPADQAWFWTKQWQEREREVDEFLAAGDVLTSASVDEFLADLDAMSTDDQ